MRNKIGKDTLAGERVLKGQVEHNLIFEKVYKHGGMKARRLSTVCGKDISVFFRKKDPAG